MNYTGKQIEWKGMVENFCADYMVEEKGKIAHIDSVITQVNNLLFFELVLNKKTNFPMTKWRHAHRHLIIEKISECLDQRPVYSLDHMTRGWKNYKLMSTRIKSREIIPKKIEIKPLRQLLKKKGYTTQESTKKIKKLKKRYYERKNKLG
jgi:hypothetical protein